jgi:hypothetical protein
MTPLQRAVFRRRHRFLRTRSGVRCRCGWAPDAGTRPSQIARAALDHLRVEKACVEREEVLFT